MTDRAKGCWVAFDRDIRTDDAEALVQAIKQLRGVSAVELNIANPDDWMNRKRIAHSMGQKIIDLIYEQHEA